MSDLSSDQSVPIDARIIMDPEFPDQLIGIYCVLRKHCHIKRNTAWPSIQTITDALGISRNTAFARLKQLEELGYISRQQGKRAGKCVTIYTVRSWEAAKAFRQPSQNLVQQPSQNLVQQPSQNLVQQPYQNLVQGRKEEEGSKRNTPIVPKGDRDADALEVYNAYPKKVGRKNALRAISKAIRAHGKEKVLKATQAYAQATKRWPPEERVYIKHPQGWFNGEYFLDDPAEWERKPKTPQHSVAMTVTSIKDIEESMRKLADRHRYSGQSWPEEDKATYRRLKAQLEALKERLHQ